MSTLTEPHSPSALLDCCTASVWAPPVLQGPSMGAEPALHLNQGIKLNCDVSLLPKIQNIFYSIIGTRNCRTLLSHIAIKKILMNQSYKIKFSLTNFNSISLLKMNFGHSKFFCEILLNYESITYQCLVLRVLCSHSVAFESIVPKAEAIARELCTPQSNTMRA